MAGRDPTLRSEKKKKEVELEKALGGHSRREFHQKKRETDAPRKAEKGDLGIFVLDYAKGWPSWGSLFPR